MKAATLQKDIPAYEGPETHLESMFIEEYLHTKGFLSIKELCNLTESEAKNILVGACRYASLKLAEIESRVRLGDEIHFQER
jgi:hypothetical protein